ncbi:MAG: tRNA (adenosine(37)-N6)-threonylcarbamoyltransferase complex ATPase subunit type 1 TsaE [bacterium]
MFARNIKETTEIAKIFLNKILKNKNSNESALVVGLSGDLGAGKTTFVQAAGKHLGVKNKITSPTFVIIKKYPIPEQFRYGSGSLKKSKNYKFFFHLDAYRLKDEKELLHLGWEEIINNKDHLVFIEWPENVSRAMPSDARFVYLSHGKSGYRNLEFK